MKNEVNINSGLNLEKLVFDRIVFNRQGFKSDKELEVEIQSFVSQKREGDAYRVTLVLRGTKQDEYTMEISLTGFFSFSCNEDLDEDFKNSVISKNTIAILMPYIRSEVSLLTAQPGMESVVLPPVNTSRMV